MPRATRERLGPGRSSLTGVGNRSTKHVLHLERAAFHCCRRGGNQSNRAARSPRRKRCWMPLVVPCRATPWHMCSLVPKDQRSTTAGRVGGRPWKISSSSASPGEEWADSYCPRLTSAAKEVMVLVGYCYLLRVSRSVCIKDRVDSSSSFSHGEHPVLPQRQMPLAETCELQYGVDD